MVVCLSSKIYKNKSIQNLHTTTLKVDIYEFDKDDTHWLFIRVKHHHWENENKSFNVCCYRKSSHVCCLCTCKVFIHRTLTPGKRFLKWVKEIPQNPRQNSVIKQTHQEWDDHWCHTCQQTQKHHHQCSLSHIHWRDSFNDSMFPSNSVFCSFCKVYCVFQDLLCVYDVVLWGWALETIDCTLQVLSFIFNNIHLQLLLFHIHLNVIMFLSY